MDKRAYLDAMGIKKWIEPTDASSIKVILVDKLEADMEFHPIITSVLALIDCPITHCTLSTSAVKGTDVIWDMRRLKVPKIPATLTSAPLSQLVEVADKKRQLWGEIGLILDAQSPKAPV